ncbi:MAG: hypothetical protein J2P36_32720 [Ktedonobacteraceae bacterium]|nr:hypothetical protein [Ktedonobacteraceae bacterium]
MNDHSGFGLLDKEFDSFHITFVRNVQEQDLLCRFGGDPALAWPLPLGNYDALDDLLYEIDDDVLNAAFFREGEDLINAIVQIGTSAGWAFAIEAYGPWSPTQHLLAVISSGTTAVSVERIGSKWLRLIDWAEDGVCKGGGEASGPFMPQLQALIEQAGVDEESDLGESLFAPVLSSAWGISFSRQFLEKPLLTGPFLFPPTQKQ